LSDVCHMRIRPGVCRASRLNFNLLGYKVAGSTVAKYRVRNRNPPSQTWKSFLWNHANQIVAIDFFIVPTVTFNILYGFVVLLHNRRQVVHFNATAHPTAEWTAQQIVEAFPEETAPRFLLRDRDSIYGEEFRRRVARMGIEEVITAARSPWQNPYAERLIGSIRRECLDHLVVFNERQLRRILQEYFAYYNEVRPHQSLEMNAPVAREVELPARGRIISLDRNVSCRKANLDKPLRTARVRFGNLSFRNWSKVQR
jgi:putative transposase